MRLIDQTILAAAALSVFIGAPSYAAPTQGACSVLTKNEVKPFSGGSPVFDQLPPQEEPSGRGSSCSYAGIVIQIDPFPFSTVDAQRNRPGAKFEAVPGVGDAAFARENSGSDDAEIFFRVGQRVATIQLNIPNGATYDSVKSRLVGLAKVLAAKLR